MSSRDDEHRSVGGYIAHFNLVDWWLETFTPEERARLARVCKQTYSLATDRTPVWTLNDGEVSSTSLSELRFLSRVAVISRDLGDRSIPDRILARAESAKGSFVDRHFYLGVLIQQTPKRETERIEQLCRESIELAPLARMWFRMVLRKRPLPGHLGYQQLAILKEKEKDYESAIELCRTALNQGWSGDWEKRIARCELRRANLAKQGGSVERDALLKIAPKLHVAIAELPEFEEADQVMTPLSIRDTDFQHRKPVFGSSASDSGIEMPG